MRSRDALTRKREATWGWSTGILTPLLRLQQSVPVGRHRHHRRYRGSGRDSTHSPRTTISRPHRDPAAPIQAQVSSEGSFFPRHIQGRAGSFLITGTDLTLDAQGDANAVWVFQMASYAHSGRSGAPRSVILVNGAQAKNVYWQVGSTATINPAGGGTMVGTIIASAGSHVLHCR